MSKSACKSDSPLSTRENKGYIDAHQIVTESSSRSHSQIYEIDLHGSNITRISNLDQFCRITTLDLSCNVISRIEGLHSCTHLKELKLYSNKISRIEGLNKLKQLCHLTLQHNRIETIGILNKGKLSCVFHYVMDLTCAKDQDCRVCKNSNGFV